jgi:hypothetical protein
MPKVLALNKFQKNFFQQYSGSRFGEIAARTGLSVPRQARAYAPLPWSMPAARNEMTLRESAASRMRNYRAARVKWTAVGRGAAARLDHGDGQALGKHLPSPMHRASFSSSLRCPNFPNYSLAAVSVIF